MKKIIIKFRARPYLWSAILLVVILGSYFYFKSGQKTPPQTVKAIQGNLVQSVSVTGTTKPTESVDLSFETSGRIISMSVDVGSRVVAGQTLAQIDSGELAAQLSEANAQVAAAQAKLDELKRGARPEDIDITKASLSQTQQDLTNLYLGIPDIVNDAYSKASDAVRKQTSGLYTNEEIAPHFTLLNNNSQLQSQAELGRVQASQELNAWKNELVSVNATTQTSTLNQALVQAKNHLSMILGFLNKTMDAVLSAANLVSQTTLNTYQSSVTTAINNVNTATTNVNTRQQAITTDVLAVTKASNQLTLQVAGSSKEDITAQEAAVAQVEANVELIRARLAKTALRSPLTGIVTKQDAKIGEIVSPSTPVVSVISAGHLEIEAFIPEIDIGKIKIGDATDITLDAYGETVKFSGHVVFVEPAATVIEGVPTYKTTLQFDNEDSRIKPGMTANLDIMTAKKDNVLVLPQRTILYEEGTTYVQILNTDGTQEKRKIELGLSGSDGNVEVVQGISAGENILRSPE